ncbi:MAG TPA: GFA family protein [Novosphingobium sp.]|nr:GFA family protein [Novosphingobium sp.]
MDLTGGCYCGAVRYRAAGPIGRKMLCYCRECQMASGGAGTVGLFVPAAGFAYTQGEPARYTRPDLDRAVTREFCGTCGTPLATRSPGIGERVVIRPGTLDDPSLFGMPDFVVWTSEKQCFHTPPEGVQTFPKFPGRG